MLLQLQAISPRSCNLPPYPKHFNNTVVFKVYLWSYTVSAYSLRHQAIESSKYTLVI